MGSEPFAAVQLLMSNKSKLDGTYTEVSVVMRVVDRNGVERALCEKVYCGVNKEGFMSAPFVSDYLLAKLQHSVMSDKSL